MRLRRLALLLAAACIGACARDSGSTGATNSADEANRAARPAILLRGNGPEPDSLDPQKARTFESQTLLRDLYECLTSLDKQAAPAPGVAREWTRSEDGLTYMFRLRPNARWSNGDPVVAEDFVFALRRLVDPATASQYAQFVDVISGAPAIIAGSAKPEILGVAAPDQATVVITLASPTPYLPALLAHPSTCPVHRPSLAAHGTAFTRPEFAVSNGAFVLEEWVPGAYLFAARNRHYWNDAATQLDGVRYFQIADENAEFLRYRAGDLHMTAVVPRGQFDLIREKYADELHIAPQLSTYYYGFNLDRAPFKDNPGLQRALSLAIDRDRLARSVLRVGELPAYGWIPPGVHDYGAQAFDYATASPEARLAEARRLYAAAGYSAANPLRFELKYNSGEVHNKVAVAVAAMWKEALGVEARLAAVELKSLLADIDRRDVDMFRLSWAGDYNDAYTFAQYLKGDFGINLPRYRNPAYDALLAQAAATTDVTRRRALLEEAERLMLADTPLMPLYFYVNKHLVSPKLRGWYDNVMNVVLSKDLSLAPEREPLT